MSCSVVRLFRCLCGCVISGLVYLVDALLNIFSDHCGCAVCRRAKAFLFGGKGRGERREERGGELSTVLGVRTGGREWRGRRILKPASKIIVSIQRRLESTETISLRQVRIAKFLRCNENDAFNGDFMTVSHVPCLIRRIVLAFKSSGIMKKSRSRLRPTVIQPDSCRPPGLIPALPGSEPATFGLPASRSTL
ncbi:hypothetical protein RRG08_012871 [Elysia crispata]|uniref:Uncharacterized protein n=1 Tax=Elysia crispata TaxID=231223 RepID=A0AAE1ASY9_9GAST|nr:hypothetical protein RRG08_012871 [Elysia crispata]